MIKVTNSQNKHLGLARSQIFCFISCQQIKKKIARFPICNSCSQENNTRNSAPTSKRLVGNGSKESPVKSNWLHQFELKSSLVAAHHTKTSPATTIKLFFFNLRFSRS